MWSASSASIPGPFPKILLAVRIPETRTLPVELIPTPPVNTPTAVSVFPPTWKVKRGSVLPTPTFPAAYMLVYPAPTSVSIH